NVTSIPFPPPDPLYRWYVRLTGLSAIAAIGALIGVLVQIDTLRRSERAWIMITPVKSDETYPPVQFKGAVRNSGKTPARIIETSIRHLPVDDFAALDNEPVFCSATKRNGMIIVPTDTFPLNVETRSLGKVQYVSGRILYKDVYGRTRETQFGFVFDF